MSRQAIADPEEIERFAKELKHFNAELQSISQRLRGQFRQLGSSWRDQEFRKFEQQFEQTSKVIQTYLRSSEAQIPVLLKKAHTLREYLGK